MHQGCFAARSTLGRVVLERVSNDPVNVRFRFTRLSKVGKVKEYLYRNVAETNAIGQKRRPALQPQQLLGEHSMSRASASPEAPSTSGSSSQLRCLALTRGCIFVP